jgi:hypothetical protein
MIEEMLDIAPRPCEEIIHAEHITTRSEEAFAQVGTDKACTTRYEHAWTLSPARLGRTPPHWSD